MNKKGFLDPDIFMSAGFVILALMAVGATAIGYIWSQKAGWGSFPIWQLLVIIIVEIGAAYLIVARG